jgi:hypothetical protein
MCCSVGPGLSARAPGRQWSAPTRCEGCTALWPPGSERQGRWWPRPWVTPRSTSPSATTWTGMLESASLRSNLRVLQGGRKAVTRGQKPVTAKPKAA